MTFQFGSGGNPAPAPSGGPSSGGGFGNLAAPSPAPGAPATGAPPPAGAAGFSFGTQSSTSTAPATGTGGGSTGGFVFGSSNNNPPAPSTSTGGPTPASAGGFAFGAPAPSTSNAPATGATTTSGPGAGFSFGGISATTTPAPATSAPAGGGFGFGNVNAGNTSNAPSTGFGNNTSNNQGSRLEVPNFGDAFPGQMLASKITPLAKRTLQGESMAGQELMQLLSPSDNTTWGSLLLKINEVWKKNPTRNQNLRTAWSNQQQEVVLRGKPATLGPAMGKEVCQISDDLDITETEALSLYAEVKAKRGNSSDVYAAARALYFDERSQFSKTLLSLLHNRLAAADNSVFLQATDPLLQKGLVKNLLAHIKDYTGRVFNLATQINDIDSGSATAAVSSINGSSSSSETDHRREVATAHWNFGIQEIQRAAECLQFISYHTQMEVDEIVELVRTIHSLTNTENDSPGMPVLHPITDAPSAFERDPVQYIPGIPFTTAPPPPREKDPMQWQQELIARCHRLGQAPLLRCVSTLVLCGITALDTEQVFVDRNSHATNSFGKGNALLPPGHCGGLSNLDPIQAVINPHAADAWSRKDVFGVLMSAFGLLLKSLPSTLVSPRGGASSSSSDGWSPAKIKQQMSDNLTQPCEHLSFTFIRLCLVPALATRSQPDAICKADEFAFDILVGWMAQYLNAIIKSRPISRKKWLQDANEDLRLRQHEQEQKRLFQKWSGTTAQLDEVPASVDLLDRCDCMDDILGCCAAVGMKGPTIAFWSGYDTLLPSDCLYSASASACADQTLRAPFFNFLAMLTTAEDPGQPQKYEAAEIIHEMLKADVPAQDDPFQWRWEDVVDVIRHYARELMGKGSGRSSSQGSSSSNRQSTSYYYFDDGHMSTPSSQNPQKSSPTTSSKLGEEGICLLASCLSVITCVASRSDGARAFLRSFSRPIHSSEGVVGHDTTPMALFTLASTAVPPVIRGLAFSALATIYQDSSQEEAIKAWELIESTGFMPIYKLQQYPTQMSENEVPTIAFPTSAVRVNEKQTKTWIPPDKSLSMIYEMEYVEALNGAFPSTTGFLQLLSSLGSTGGFPSNLGENWRGRTGCSPYIEYAMCLVLPRATGTFGAFPALPFRSAREKNCLCMAALKLINIAAGQYVVPLFFTNEASKDLYDSLAAAKRQASKVLGLQSLVEDANLIPKQDDFRSFANDMYPGSSASVASSTVSGEPSQAFPQSASPPPKSAGFTVLTAVLRTDRNSLSATLAALLINRGGRPVADPDDLALSLSLFRHLRPSFDSSKSANPRERSKLSKLLVPLLPEDDHGQPSSVRVLEGLVAQALQLLCIVASKEEAFSQVASHARLDKMVPTLHFSVRRSSPEVWNLHGLSRIRDKLESFGLVSALSSFMSRVSENIAIPSCAIALLFLLKDSADISRRREMISRACSELVTHLATKSPSSAESANLFSFFLETLLKELKNKQTTFLGECLACEPIVQSLVNASASTELLLSTKSARVAAFCYESIFLLNRKLGSSQYLPNFWYHSTSSVWPLVRRVSFGDAPIDLLASMAWILKGLTDALLWNCSRPGVNVLQGTGPVDGTIRLLCEDGILFELYSCLPCDSTGYSSCLSDALHYCLGFILVAASQSSRDVDLIGIIDALLRQLGGDFDAATQRNLSLALYASVYHANMPPKPTAELSSRLCDAIICVPSSNAILVATLVLALRRMGPGIDDEEIIEKMLLQVSKRLFHMCCEVTNEFLATPTSEGSIARAALQLLWSLAPDSTVRKVLVDSATFGRKHTPLDEMVSLVGRLDRDICSLLSVVGRVPLGSQELVRAGVLVKLQEGGIKYRQHIESTQNRNPLQPHGYPVPSFLCYHLQLCSLILSTVPANLLHDAARHVDNILKLYEPEVSQMLKEFPNHGDTTTEYLRTVGIVLRAFRRFSLNSGAYALRSPIPAFVFSLLKTPLPRSCLGPIPKALLRHNTQGAPDLVDTPAAETSWWDGLILQQSELQTSDLCAIGRKGADMILSGLFIVQHTMSISSVDPATLGRSLVAVVDSIVFVDRCRAENASVVEHLHLLREQLVKVSMELLQLSIRLAQSAKQDNSTPATAMFAKDIKHCLLAALDRVQLQTIDFCSRAGADRKKQQLLGIVARALRDHLK